MGSMIWWVLLLVSFFLLIWCVDRLRRFKKASAQGKLAIVLAFLLAVGAVLISLLGYAMARALERDIEEIGGAYVITTDNDNDASNYIRESGKAFSEIELLGDDCRIIFYKGGVAVDEVTLPKNKIELFVLEDGNELSQKIAIVKYSQTWFGYQPNMALSHFTQGVNLWMLPAEAAYFFGP